MQETLSRERRLFLKSAGAGFVATIASQRAKGADTGKAEFKALEEGDRIAIGRKPEQIMEEAYRLGYDLEKKHGGCARCTVAALQRAVEFIPEDKGLFRASSCLDGGATPNGIQNCGAFTGSGMVIGWTCGSDALGATRLSHKLIREVCRRFEAEYGSVLCKDVRQKAERNCPEVVARAAKWTAEVLLMQFADYRPKSGSQQGESHG